MKRIFKAFGGLVYILIKNYLISFFLIALAGAYSGIMDILKFKYKISVFNKLFPAPSKIGLWLGGNDPFNLGQYWYIHSFFRDGWHCAKGLLVTAFIINLILLIAKDRVILNWRQVVVVFLLFALCWGLGFVLFYDYLLIL